MFKSIKRLMTALLSVVLLISLIPVSVLAEDGNESTALEYSIRYTSHVQRIGWQEYVSDGETSGTSGQSLRLEGMKIGVYDVSGRRPKLIENGVEYAVHVQSIGWQDERYDDDMAGTSGRSLRLEAITITPGSAISDDYDIYYRVHAQRYGWLGWAKNGEMAGTADMSLRLEAIEIRLVAKNSDDAPSRDARSFYSSTAKGLVTYQTHVQGYGWMTSVADGSLSGTQGESKRVEALKIWIDNPRDDQGKLIKGGIEYAAYVQGIGWLDYVSEGEMAGTSGQSRAVEAVKIRLTGDLAEQYNVYYAVHIRKFGSLGWACNGGIAGSMDHSCRVESIEIYMRKKSLNDTTDLNSGTRSYLSPQLAGTLTYAAGAMGSQEMDSYAEAYETAGSTGSGRALESIVINLDNSAAGCYSGNISYRVHVANAGWQEWVEGGCYSGTLGSGNQIEAFQITVSDELAKYCDVIYQVHIQDFGWLGWAANGSTAGSTGLGLRMEAFRIRLVAKGTVTVSNGELSYATGFCHPCPDSVITDYFGSNRNHKGIDFGADTGTPVYAAYYGTVIEAGSNSYNGKYIYINHGNGYVTKYLHCSAIYVSQGQTVTRGQHIAAVGSTGQSTGPHLHFQVEVNGTPVNPLNYLPD